MTESSLPASVTATFPRVGQHTTLIDRCLAGEELAFIEVYNLYASTIYRLCYSLLQHREDAEEVMQDAFEYAFRRMETFDDSKSAFKTWLYQIAVSRCRNKRRRKWLETIPLTNLIRDRLADERAINPAESLALDERHKKVWEALAKLSPKLRETAVLRYYEELTYMEIGQILSIPAKTAESRMRLAHKALAHHLAEIPGSLNQEGNYESNE